MEVLSRLATPAATATTVEFTFTDLAKDRMLILSNIAIRADPGATQALTSLQVFGFTPGRLEFDIVRLNPVITADLTQDLNWQGQVYLLGGGTPSNTLRFRAGFDAGVNSNALRIGFHGIVVPRANVAPF